MSNLFKYTKRVLTSVLAAAVVLTAIPSTAFGAEIIDEDLAVVDVQEENAEAVEAEEEALTVDGTSGEDEPVVIEEEENEPDKYVGDIKIKFINGTTGDVQVNLCESKGDTSLASVIANNTVKDDAATEADYEFYVAPKLAPAASAFQLADAPVTVKWTDYSAETTVAGTGTEKTAVAGTDYSIDDTNNETWNTAGVKKVTLKKEFLAKVLEKSYIDKEEPTQATAYSTFGVSVTAADAEAKTIYVAFDLTNAAGCSPAISPKSAALTWEYNSAASDDYSLLMGTSVITGLTAPNEASYKLLQEGSGLDDDLDKPTVNPLDKTEYTAFVKTTGTYSATDIDPDDAETMVEYNTTDKKIYVALELLNKAAASGRTVKIAIDTRKSESPKYTSVTADTESAKYVDFNLTGAKDKKISEQLPIVASPKSVDVAAAGDLDTIKNVAPARVIKKVKVSADGGTTFTDATHDAGTNYHLAKDIYTEAKAVVVYAEAEDGIVIKNNKGILNTDFRVVGNSGNDAGSTAIDGAGAGVQPVTGKPYSFKVTSLKATTSITKVEYQFGKAAATEATKNADGSWSATTPYVSNTLTITVTLDDNNTVKTVAKAGTAAADAVLNDKITGTPITTTATGQNFVTVGKPYTFTLTPAATKYITKISYKDGVKDAVNLTPADAVSVDDNGVMTFTTKEAIESDLIINVDESVNGYKLTAPVNKNVRVSFAEAGKSIYVNGEEEFPFSVVLDSNATGVTFKSIGISGVPAKYGTKTGSYKIAADTIDVALLAVTEQVVPRNQYQVEWKAANGTDPDPDHLKLTKVDKTATTWGKSDTEQSLTLAGTETIDLTATYTANSAIALSGTTVDTKSGMALKSDDATKAVVTLGNGSSAVTVTADNFKTESNALVATVKTADYAIDGTSMAGNTLIYNAELPVTVVPQFSGFKAVVANNASYSTGAVIEGAYTDATVYFHVLGTNGRTGAESLVTDSLTTVSGISWTTNPNVKGMGDPDFTVTGGYADSKLQTSGFKATVTSVAATPTVTLADSASTKIAGTAGTVKISPKATYKAYPVVTVKNGEEDTFVATNDGFIIAATGSMNQLTVDYKVYKEVKDGAIAGIGDKDALAKAIEDGDIVLATLDAAPTVTLANEDTTTTVYVEGSTSTTPYTLTGKKATPTSPAKPVDVKINATIDKIKLPEFVIKATVKNQMDPTSVTLRIVNPDAKTDSAVNRQVLTKDPTFVGDVSKVLIEKSKTDGTSAGTGTTYGVKYNGVSTGSTFTLPALSDFDSTKFGKNATTGVSFVPYGWIYDRGGANTYYELGATNVPLGDNTKEFELLWGPKYALDDVWNENDKDANGDYQNSLKSNFHVAIDGNIPVTLETSELVGIYTESDASASINAGDPKFTTTYVKSGFTITESTTPDKLLDQTKLGNYTISGKYTGSATASVEWTDPDNTKHPQPLGAITVDAKKNLTLEVNTATTTLNDKDELELTVGKAGKNLDVLLKNNGTAEDVTGYTFTVTEGSTIIKKGTLTNGATGVKRIPLTAKSVGSTTVTVTVSDVQGTTVGTPLVVKVKVADSAVRFAVTKKVGDQKVAVDSLELSVAESDIGNLKFSEMKLANINIQAFAKTGSTTPLTDGTWTVTGDGITVAASPVKADDSEGGINVAVTKAATDASTFGTGKLTVTYKAKDDTDPYTFDVPVVAYKPVVLLKGANVAVVDKNGNRVQDSSTTPATLQNAFLKAYRDESDEAKADPNKEAYVIDLQGYTAEYTDGSAMEFAGWRVSDADHVAPFATETIDLSATSAEFNAASAAKAKGLQSDKGIASISLEAQFTDVPIKSIEFVNVTDNKITLTDEVTSKDDASKATAYKVVKMRVTDAKSNDTIDVVSSKVGFFQIVDEKDAIGTTAPNIGKYVGTYDFTVSNPAGGTTNLTVGKTYDADKNTRVNEFTVGVEKGQAGSTELAFKSHTSGKTLATVTLSVDGAVYTAGLVTGYIENGEAVKSDVRTVAGNKIFFDKDGKALTKSGVTYVKSIDKNVLVNVVTPGVKHVTFGKGVQTVEGKQYYVKDDETGEVAFTELIEVAGVQRYANSEGVLVTHDMATDGKYTDPETGIVYKIDKDTNAAEQDDKKLVQGTPEFTWKPEKNKDYNHNTSTVTATVTVNFKLEKAGTTGTETLDATVVKDNVASVGNKDVYKATVTAAGYYTKDGKAEYDWSKVTATKTYTYDPSSGQGKSGGIEILGMNEEYDFTGKAIVPVISVWDNDRDVKLVEGVDFTYTAKNNTKVSKSAASDKKPIVIVTGKNNYTGKTVTKNFEIVNPADAEGYATSVKSIKKGDSKEAFTYDGVEHAPTSLTVVADNKTYEYKWNGSSYDKVNEVDGDVAITVANNINAGTATVAAVGKDGKSKSTTFKINKVDLSKQTTATLEIVPEDTEWAVKGVVPEVKVTYTPDGGSPIELVPGQDFTVAAVKKDVSEGNTVKITGKGKNFQKAATSTATFEITPCTITDASILSVTAYAGQKKKNVKATVVDGNGTVIKAKSYTINVYDSDSNPLGDRDELKAGEEYKVQVVAPSTGNITGSGEFEFTAAADMSKAKVTLSPNLKKNGVAYTGEAIDITNIQSDELIRNLFDSDITVEYKNPSTKKYEKLTWDEDFEVVGYQNNVKKGTMTVYIRAKDDSTKVSGVKNFKIKISAKTMKKTED